MRDGADSLIPMSPLEPLLDGLFDQHASHNPCKVPFIRTFTLLILKSSHMHLHMCRSLKSYIMGTFNRGMIFGCTLSGLSKGHASWSLVFKAILKKRNVSKAQCSLKKISSFVISYFGKKAMFGTFSCGGGGG